MYVITEVVSETEISGNAILDNSRNDEVEDLERCISKSIVHNSRL